MPVAAISEETYIKVTRRVHGGGAFRVEEREVVVSQFSTHVLEERRADWLDDSGDPLGAWVVDLPMLRWVLHEENSVAEGRQHYPYSAVYAAEAIQQARVTT